MRDITTRHIQAVGLQGTYATGRFGEDDSYHVNQVFGTSPLGGVLCSMGSEYVVEMFPDGTGRSWFAGSEVTSNNETNKAWYIRDKESGKLWSAFFNPVGDKGDEYEVSYSPGQVSAYCLSHKIASTLTVSTLPNRPVEVWHIKLENRSASARTIELTTYIEPLLSKVLESRYMQDDKALLLRRSLDSVIGLTSHPHDNMVFFHSCTLTPSRHESCKTRFTGKNGSLSAPEYFSSDPVSGKEPAGPAIASLSIEIELPIEGEAEVGFVFGVANNAQHAIEIISGLRKTDDIKNAIQTTRSKWAKLCSSIQVKTQDSAFDALVNTWLPYEMYSAWIRDRELESYLDPSKIADVLRRMLPFCATAPRLCSDSLVDFAAGLSMVGTHSRDSRCIIKLPAYELLWLAYLCMKYVAETGDKNVLSHSTILKDGPALSIKEHCERAIRMCLNSTSEGVSAEDKWLLEQTMDLWKFISEDAREFTQRYNTEEADMAYDCDNNFQLELLPRRIRFLRSISPTLSDKSATKVLYDNVKADRDEDWTTSAACSLYQGIASKMLGLRATCEGLIINPAMPNSWLECSITRRFRSDIYDIHIQRATGASNTGMSMVVDDEPVLGHMLPYYGDGKRHRVDITVD